MAESLHILQQTKRKIKQKCIRKHRGELAQGVVIFGGYNRILTTKLHFEFNNINIKRSFSFICHVHHVAALSILSTEGIRLGRLHKQQWSLTHKKQHAAYYQ